MIITELFKPNETAEFFIVGYVIDGQEIVEDGFSIVSLSDGGLNIEAKNYVSLIAKREASFSKKVKVLMPSNTPTSKDDSHWDDFYEKHLKAHLQNSENWINSSEIE
jgi:hypothetical protein